MSEATTNEKTRTQLLQEIAATRKDHENHPGEQKVHFQLAELLFNAGEFWEARDLVQGLMDDEPSNQVLFLAAHLDYLLGNYESAEKLYLDLIQKQNEDVPARVQSEIKLLFTYYQTNQFDKSHSLLKGLEGAIQLPIWDQMKSFEVSPYQIDWNGKEKEIVPFIITDPLPMIEIEIQGKKIYSLIDTGGDNLYLDDEYAAELGIEAVASAVGKFGGGKEGTIGFAKGTNLKLDDITMNPVPITIMPTQRWSKGFADGKYTIGGVIGTGILRQFLATIDYPSTQLILRPRDAAGKQALQEEQKGQEVTEVPFVLEATHLMMAKGSLNDLDDLTYFVDSGLASSASFISPIQTLKYAGIPIPETAVNKDGIGGGGEGLWATGSFDIKKLGLGSLVHGNVEGDYGTLTPESYWKFGFIQDGLISHNFLRRYRWTLDFDEMKYLFIKPEK